jgi:hypothetical protein
MKILPYGGHLGIQAQEFILRGQDTHQKEILIDINNNPCNLSQGFNF